MHINIIITIIALIDVTQARLAALCEPQSKRTMHVHCATTARYTIDLRPTISPT